MKLIICFASNVLLLLLLVMIFSFFSLSRDLFFLRLEEHRRLNDNSKELSETALSKLKNEEFLWLRKHFQLTTPYIRQVSILGQLFPLGFEYIKSI